MSFTAKKSLGQHFLTSTQIAQRIVEAGSISQGDIVVEIGPGKGFLTKLLLQTSLKHLITYEKDNRLPDLLRQKFEEAINIKKLEIVEIDALSAIPPKEPYKIIANIPYYITGLILKKFLSDSHPPTKMVLLVQKEVAERIISKDNKESILSLSVKAYGTPRIITTVSRKKFSPPPNVDSAVLCIDSISKDYFTTHKIEEELFFNVIKLAFGQKRKKLHTTLFKKQIQDRGIRSEIIEYYKNKRPEELTLQDWAHIIKHLY
jgi:16S rRNA (adenine1518-N6/adenine1519-N6)-dimethyltransferase